MFRLLSETNSENVIDASRNRGCSPHLQSEVRKDTADAGSAELASELVLLAG